MRALQQRCQALSTMDAFVSQKTTLFGLELLLLCLFDLVSPLFFVFERMEAFDDFLALCDR